MCGEVVAAPLSLQDTVYPILRKKSLHFCEKSKKFMKLCHHAKGSPGGAVERSETEGLQIGGAGKTVKRSSRRTGVNLQFFPV